MSACIDIRNFVTLLRRAAQSTGRLALQIHDRIPHHHNANRNQFYFYDFYAQTSFLRPTSGRVLDPHEFLFKLLVESTAPSAAGAVAGSGFMGSLKVRIYNHFMNKIHLHCKRLHEFHNYLHGYADSAEGAGHRHGGRLGSGSGSAQNGGGSRFSFCGKHRHRHSRHSNHNSYNHSYFNETNPRFHFDKSRFNRVILRNLKMKAFAYKCLFLNRLFHTYPHYHTNMMMRSRPGMRSFFSTQRFNNHPFTRPVFWLTNPYSAGGYKQRFFSYAPRAGLYELYKVKKDQIKLQQQQLKHRFRLSGKILVSSGGSRLLGSNHGYESPAQMMKLLWFQQTRGYINSSSNSYTSHIQAMSPFEAVEETNRIIGKRLILEPFAVEERQMQSQRIEEIYDETSSIVLIGASNPTIPQAEVTPFDVTADLTAENRRSNQRANQPKITNNNNNGAISTSTSTATILPSTPEYPSPSTTYPLLTPFETISPATESSFVDFDITPRFSLPTTGVDLTEESLSTIEKDMELHLQEVRNIISDIRRIANLGELPITIERNGNVIRVHFPNADSQKVEQLLFELEVTRGLIMDNIGPTHLFSITAENSIASSSPSPSTTTSTSTTRSFTRESSTSTRSEDHLTSSASPITSSVETPPSLGQAPIEELSLLAEITTTTLDEDYTWSYVGGSINSDIPTPELTESCGSTVSSGECSSVLMAMRI